MYYDACDWSSNGECGKAQADRFRKLDPKTSKYVYARFSYA
jgi:hypothetical protein